MAISQPNSTEHQSWGREGISWTTPPQPTLTVKAIPDNIGSLFLGMQPYSDSIIENSESALCVSHHLQEGRHN